MSRNGRLDWVRSETNFDEHPQAIAAGFEGCTIFQALCRVSGAFGLGGRVKAMYLTESWLCRRLNGATPDFVRAGVAACIRSGLVTRDGDSVIIPDWDRFIGSDTARKQEQRSKQKQPVGKDCPGIVPDSPQMSPTDPTYPTDETNELEPPSPPPEGGDTLKDAPAAKTKSRRRPRGPNQGIVTAPTPPKGQRPTCACGKPASEGSTPSRTCDGWAVDRNGAPACADCYCASLDDEPIP